MIIKCRSWRFLVLAALLIVMPSSAWAQEGGDGESDAEEGAEAAEEATGEEASEPSPPLPSRLSLRPVYIIGERPGDLEFVPGSASVVTEEDLIHYAPRTSNDVLRTLPGVHVSESSDGFGLRPQIGIRGLDPNMSRNVLVLEDGVPIALAPYGEPEMYYAPPIERMRGIEVVKGSGSILHGPQTIGGVVNFLTLDPPSERSGMVEARVGTFDYWQGHAVFGDTVGQVGYVFHAMHQRYGGPRNLNLEVTDVMGKFRLQLDDRSSLELKVGLYDEISNATYVGLTTAQYEANPRFNFATNDVLPVRRYNASVTLNTLLSDMALLQVTAYGFQTTRNWQRQDYDRSPEAGRFYPRAYDGEGVLLSDPSAGPTDGSGIFFRNSTGNRNRAFTVAGLEPRLSADYAIGSVDAELSAGVRYHYEQASEQRVDGTFGASRSGVLREDELRTGHAFAGYALNRFIIADRLRISPGVRMEHLNHSREVFRARVDGTPTDLNPPATSSTVTTAFIPGLGVSYELTPQLVAFTGVHRGFAPPRTKDAMTNDGSSLELDAEYSWNSELGLRYAGDFFGAEAAGFLLDFSNQIITPAQSAGGEGTGGLVNSGETRHLGAEAAATFDAATMLDAGFRLPLTLTYTFVSAEYRDGWNEEISGNRLPYAPRHQLNASLRLVHPVGLSAQVGAHYMSEQYSDRLETREPSANGEVGLIDSRLLLDARVGYTIESLGLTAYAAGKNLTDRNYIGTRRPQGIQPGPPREVFFGLRADF